MILTLIFKIVEQFYQGSMGFNWERGNKTISKISTPHFEKKHYVAKTTWIPHPNENPKTAEYRKKLSSLIFS